jgi:hypothetical protein
MRQNPKQARAKRKAALEKLAVRLRFKLADEPGNPAADSWRDQLKRIEKTLNYFEDSPYILKHDPFFADKVQVKIMRLEQLSQFYRRVNATWRKTGGFEGVLLTKYWREKIEENVTLYGIPFPEKVFWNLRTTLKYFRRRV